MSTDRPRRVIVVGGGVTGLTAALEIATGRTGDVSVEVRESADRVGGKLRTTPFAGRAGVDEGADAFLTRVPSAVGLARRLGVELTSPQPARAAVWHDGLHDLPDGVLLGVPTDLARLARSRLLSWPAKMRAAAEPLLPRRGDPGDSIGALVRSRFGDEVHERLVDALVGSIYGADTDRFSLAMVPQLAALGRHRSLLLGARRLRATAAPADGPVFEAPTAGMEELARAVTAAAEAAGVAVRRSTPVGRVERDGAAWRVDGERADAVVLASPAAATAPLVRATLPDLAGLLAAMDHAGVVIVTLAVPSLPERFAGRSGYLVTKRDQATVTAVSFGSQKWAHWRGEGEVLRVSLGRDGLPVGHLDDGELLRRAVDEAGRQLDVDLQPTAHRISRWPAAFPQYRPGHLRWLEAVDAATPPGLFTAGASYRGIGVPACVADAQRAAAAVLDHLATVLVNSR